MNDPFQIAVSKVLEREGEWSHDPHDRGGETRYGISSRWHGSVRSLTRDDAIALYREHYWDAARLGDLAAISPDLAATMLDAVVLHGRAVAVKSLQRALRIIGEDVVVDGILGAETLGAVRWVVESGFEHELRWQLRARRILLVVNLVLADPTQLKFLRGWINRILEA